MFSDSSLAFEIPGTVAKGQALFRVEVQSRIASKGLVVYFVPEGALDKFKGHIENAALYEIARVDRMRWEGKVEQSTTA